MFDRRFFSQCINKSDDCFLVQKNPSILEENLKYASEFSRDCVATLYCSHYESNSSVVFLIHRIIEEVLFFCWNPIYLQFGMYALILTNDFEI